MSNTVSTEATLFSTTHPDVVKRTSVSSIIISAILCVIGAGAFATSLKMGDSSSTMSMVLMAGRCIYPFLASPEKAEYGPQKQNGSTGHKHHAHGG